MPLIRLVQEKLNSKINFPRLRLKKAFSPSNPQQSPSKTRKAALNTDRDGFANLVDGAELPPATWWASRGSLPDDEVGMSTEEILPMGRVHVRSDFHVSHDHV